MANETYSKEWLQKAYHDLDSANILFTSGHYTDTIGYLYYHQAIEKSLKSIIAFENKPIHKTHNLIELHEMLDKYLDLNEDELILLAKITTYYIKQRYPALDKKLPKREEISQAKEFAKYLFNKVCNILEIDKNEITK